MARKKAKKKHKKMTQRERKLDDQVDRLSVKLEESKDATRTVIEQRDEWETSRDKLRKQNDRQAKELEKVRDRTGPEKLSTG